MYNESLHITHAMDCISCGKGKRATAARMLSISAGGGSMRSNWPNSLSISSSEDWSSLFSEKSIWGEYFITTPFYVIRIIAVNTNNIRKEFHSFSDFLSKSHNLRKT